MNRRLGPISVNRVLAYREQQRVTAIRESLEDEVYEAASVGNVKRADYLENFVPGMFVRAQQRAGARRQQERQAA